MGSVWNKTGIRLPYGHRIKLGTLPVAVHTACRRSLMFAFDIYATHKDVRDTITNPKQRPL